MSFQNNNIGCLQNQEIEFNFSAATLGARDGWSYVIKLLDKSE